MYKMFEASGPDCSFERSLLVKTSNLNACSVLSSRGKFPKKSLWITRTA